MEIPILATKLFIPEARKELVVRERLYKKLDEGIDKKLILISAPAGFGKSTLVSSWAVESGKDVAWLSLDKDDNQMPRFLNYLAAALQKVDSAIGKEAAQMLAAKSQAPADAVLTSLINDLDTSSKEIFFVLEDFHFISSKSIHEATTFLLEHCPKTLHLVITTRSDPLLPITRLRARGQIIELRAADLRFSDAEAVQFLNDIMELHLDAGMVRVLEERTEGWIAGLQMAALSMRSHKNAGKFIKDFSGTNRYIMDYLLEEVLANLPAEIQQFLLYTSILRRLSAPLCGALLEIDESADRKNGYLATINDHGPLNQSAAALEYLEKKNLFLVPLDEERIWYRYHDLFADMLQTRLQQIQPDLIALLHVRASIWLEQNGLISEAIHHLCGANRLDRAADLIERYGPARLAENDPSIIQMADYLPHEMVLTRPKIGLYQVWLLIIQGRIDKARPLLDNLAIQFCSADSTIQQGWMQTFISLASAFLSPISNSGELVPLPKYKLLEEIPCEDRILRNAADYLYAMTLARQDDMDGAVEVSLKCIRRENPKHETEVIPTLAPFLSRIYLMQGRLTKAAALCQEYLTPIKKGNFQIVYTSGSMKIDMGEVMYERNRLEEAERHIREGLRANELWRNIMTDGFGLTALTRVLLAKGDHAEAMKVVEKFETKMQARSRPHEFDEDLLTLRVRVQLASGNTKDASLWAEQIQHLTDYESNKHLYRLTLARIRMAQGKYDLVEKLLTRATLPSAPGSQIARELETDLLLAAAFAGQRRMAEALDLLDSCLSIAEPERYTRVFLDSGDPARELLKTYSQSPTAAHKLFAQKVLDEFLRSDQAKPASKQQSGLIEPLSEREIEVLQLIATGKTNREIASQLIIAAGTVKAHTSSIYRKLNVYNRTEAAARARQLGILA